MHTYSDENGNSLTLAQWAAMQHAHSMGKVLAIDLVSRDGAQVTVKTMWFGLTVPALNVKPFGTAVSEGRWSEVAQYDTKAEALAGHRAIIEQYAQAR